ncbi:stearoyl-CoA 9-desaturase [Bacteriovorax sp. BSW11_IV]|uniref:acyl-CoA desaturase n=1 Tax=Bacteriovorax sp. BSW11_IV TaxID=1353529 RepID=UPI00038A0795|nr:fatty acid desaturase [Bacteriovorax sp. BSW11_IV]EQC43631.1 stearoyl-CoA 9-desaturase [Bacteriovorax sp. BSW11_IV]
MNTRYQLKNLNLTNTVFLIVTPILAITLTTYIFLTQTVSMPQYALLIFFYFATGFSITAGYHRLFAHRAYKAHWSVKLFFLLFGAATFQNSCLKWATDHRRHHTNVDTEEDPYNIGEGFFYAHIGWVLLKEKEKYMNQFPKDLVNDKLVMWQHKYYLPLCAFMGLFLPGLIGMAFGSFLQGFVLAGLFRVVFVHHATFFINSLCHMVGSVTYSSEHTAKDSWIMAIFTYGEGYHNFHHTFQTDYRNGIKWFHFDPSKWIIWTLSKLGLAKNLKITAVEDIELAKLQVQMEKKLVSSENGGLNDRLVTIFEQLRTNLMEQKRSRRLGDSDTLGQLCQQYSYLLDHFRNLSPA